MAKKRTSQTKKTVVKATPVKKTVPQQVQEVRSNHIARLLLILALITVAGYFLYSLY